ncbi:MAG: bifunctional 5,10-methylenetetrahydrofolate dehydrogenase/5,10-methenyltetrahydrofolate cyclohydrolase [Silvanigrellaceae bacterium]|nr:bifunctional 5,10-methylenetetrahydrofolate dehydrogenase/5,10-methenyltetrahydrofolate cyclohydrolase [Silvanigrellaceae bacterium]
MNFFAQAIHVGFTLPDLSNKLSYFPHSNCLLLDGRSVQDHFVAQAKILKEKNNITPSLSVILVGEHASSKVYVENKLKIFTKAGFHSQLFHFSAQSVTEEEIFNVIEMLNQDKNTHGILVQLPLPEHLSSEKFLERISPNKDVDGFLKENIGALALGQYTSFIPCTPFGILCLLYAYKIPIAGKNIVIMGRSNIVSKPLGLLLLNLDATVTFTHSKTLNLREITQTADILMSATGQSKMVTKDYIKPGCIVVDVGITRDKNSLKICGDTLQDDIIAKASALTPVPGGVGPITIAMLLVNTAIAAWAKNF